MWLFSFSQACSRRSTSKSISAGFILAVELYYIWLIMAWIKIVLSKVRSFSIRITFSECLLTPILVDARFWIADLYIIYKYLSKSGWIIENTFCNDSSTHIYIFALGSFISLQMQSAVSIWLVLLLLKISGFVLIISNSCSQFSSLVRQSLAIILPKMSFRLSIDCWSTSPGELL